MHSSRDDDYQETLRRPSDAWERVPGTLIDRRRVASREATVEHVARRDETNQWFWKVTYWRRPDARLLASGRSRSKHVAMRCANSILDILTEFEKGAAREEGP
jgi:hypothetical protein